jgi:hypothetical protein
MGVKRARLRIKEIGLFLRGLPGQKGVEEFRPLSERWHPYIGDHEGGDGPLVGVQMVVLIPVEPIEAEGSPYH